MFRALLICLSWLIFTEGHTDEVQAIPSDMVLPDDIGGTPEPTGPLSFDDDGHTAVQSESGSFLGNQLTFKLSQQIYSQLSQHHTDSGRLKKATIEDNRLSLNLKYQNNFAPTWNLQGSAQAKIYWPTDYEFGTDNESIDMEARLENMESRLNEFYFTKNLANHTLKFGRQTIVWGEAEGNSVLDTLNTTEYRDLSIIEIEDARLNQWFVLWDYFDGNTKLSSFVNLDPQFNPAIRKNSPAYTPQAFSLPKEDGQTRFEAGSRLQWSIEHSDFALMTAYLFDNQLRYDVPPTFSGITAKESGYWMVGASANRAIGKLLLKLDLVYNHGLLEDTLLAPEAPFFTTRVSSVRKNQFGTSLGFEYALDNVQSISLSAQARYYLDRYEDLAAGERPAFDTVFGTWLMRYNHSFSNGDWVFSSTMNGSLNGDRVLASGMLMYTVDDHWSVMGQLIGTWASKNSALAVLDQDVRLGLTITYSH
jgi:hypothetical protein